MVSNLIGGVSRKIRGEFECPVYADETVFQGLSEPCFFIALTRASRSPLPGSRSRFRAQMDIAYFPRISGSYAEGWEVGGRLLTLLRVVQLGDGDAVRGKNISFEIVDGILHAYVLYELHLLEIEDEPEGEVMEDILDYIWVQ